MHRRWRGQWVNIALMMTAVGLLTAVVVTTGSVTSSQQEARKHNLLVSYAESELSRITLERSSQDKVVLTRDVAPDADDSGWRLIEPVAEEPEAEAIRNLVGSLELATVVRRIVPEAVDRAAFGLDAPRVVVNLQMGRRSYRLVLGGPAPSPAGASYIEVAGDGVVGEGVAVISADLVKQLDVSLDELRGRQLLPYLATSLRSLVLEGEGGTRQLRREGKRWRFAGMHGDLLVDRDASDGIAVQLSRAKATRFLSMPEARAAQRGAATITVTAQPVAAGRPPAVVVLGGQCPGSENLIVGVRRKPSPVAACIPAHVMGALRRTAEQLTARGAFSLRVDEVERVVAQSSGRRLEFERQGSEFVLRAPRRAQVNLEAGNRRIESMLALRGRLVSVDDPARIGLDLSWGKVTLTSAARVDDKAIEETAEVSKPTTAGPVYVRRALDGALLQLDRESARVLHADAMLLRSLQVLDFPLSRVRSVQVEWQGHAQRVSRDPTGNLRLERPPDFDADVSLATGLMETLGSLTADRWVADEDDGSFGLGQPSLRARIELSAADAGPAQRDLIVGHPAGAGAYAKLGGDSGVFVLPNNALERLRTWLIDRAVLVANASEMTAVELQVGQRQVALIREGDRFVQAAGEPKLPALRIQSIIDALGSMRAEAALHPGPSTPAEGFDDPQLVVRIRRDPGTRNSQSWAVGAGDAWRGMSVYYARAASVDATYVIARGKVQKIIGALERPSLP